MSAPPPPPGGPAPEPATEDRRRAVWQILDNAYTDGRIGPLEHGERSRDAALSTTRDDLDSLVADLNRRLFELEVRSRGLSADTPLSVRRTNTRERIVAKRPPGPSTRGPAGRRRLASGLLRAVLASALTVGLIAGLDHLAGNAPSPTGGTVDRPASVEVIRTAPGPLLTAEGVTRVIDAARDQLDDPTAERLVIEGETAHLSRADPDGAETTLRHTFHGRWRDGITSRLPASTGFPVAAVDAETVMFAIEATPALLGAPGAVPDRVVISPGSPPSDSGPPPVYAVRVSLTDRPGWVTVGPGREILEVGDGG